MGKHRRFIRQPGKSQPGTVLDLTAFGGEDDGKIIRLPGWIAAELARRLYGSEMVYGPHAAIPKERIIQVLTDMHNEGVLS